MKSKFKLHYIIMSVLVVITIVALGVGPSIYTYVIGNKQFGDLNQKYTYAYIDIPGGRVVEGKVESWRDYADGDQIQVTIDGKVYLTDSTRCVLVNEGNYHE